ncbi:hypothetical protein [Campylobacter concisus]|uniref:Uncharacterized protein n=1 Tax=Campylobacter concisus TaxID=199 RepID=A0A7S9WWV8_9BACT|nr:hypothetical protein [Campylobacter concisus]QPH96293.1 hypothetical protein CVT08_03090 [Campylobacter concisus]
MTKSLQKSPEGVPHIISINKDCQRCEMDEDKILRYLFKSSLKGLLKEFVKDIL